MTIAQQFLQVFLDIRFHRDCQLLLINLRNPGLRVAALIFKTEKLGICFMRFLTDPLHY
jgi:hypothetical protein